MLINADFSRPANVAPHEYQWVASPQSGVERVMLDRVGAEKARSTSIVRYAPDSSFPRHVHPGGEEILVLAGTLSEGDEHYPAGWYLRNPPYSSHQPSSREGAIIFVKLQQMRADERRRVRINTYDPAAWRRQNGREICPLFSDDVEQVCLQRLAPNEVLFAEPVEGAELLVLAGDVLADEQSYGRGSWMRLPVGDSSRIAAGAHGATVYLKTGHLAAVVVEA
ncbi:cupin domain-containing protein [Paraburkholderia sp. DHOC27]|uniref:cupin domain-containing protein n=1 Tax=Paraburkholderia sp. DHOC27 TaxID=2303330 RepID=UPI000E3C02E6|nr:cupin domain-containing protein [Paraburkholderia sp. DHOC27]RFU45442.1 anti-sigma factor [Paraburkholderia sp. DHOC27]